MGDGKALKRVFKELQTPWFLVFKAGVLVLFLFWGRRSGRTVVNRMGYIGLQSFPNGIWGYTAKDDFQLPQWFSEGT